jgi:hypothetical protein
VSYLKKLKATTDRKGLAALLGYQPSKLTAIVYMTPLSAKYFTFDIPKKSGGKRTIKAPERKLKKLQAHLAHVLQACLIEIEADKLSGPVSFGFRKEGRITDNAKVHKGRRYVLNIDLADFFPSFHFGRVRGFFLKDKNFELPDQVATTIAQIACDGAALPQGSPCSPIISELIGRVLDVRLLRLAKKHRVTYSRYADDITFSTNNKAFPTALASQDPADPAKWVLGDELVNKVHGSGFQINPDKTRMSCRGSRQMVTGLVVNSKVNIKSEYYRNARAMCDSLFQSGVYFRDFVIPEKDDDLITPNYISSLNTLEGILSFAYNVTQSKESREIAEQRKNPRAIRELYRRFLFYKYCVAPSHPLLITEGKTDPVYLREAIMRQTAYHPTLGEFGPKGFKFAVRFFNYEGQAHEIMDLGGGTGDLKSVPMDYLRNFKPYRKRKPFKHKPMRHPVIIALDNDEGLKGVASFLKENFGTTISPTTKDDFYHIIENLYVIKTPETGQKTCIESMFPDKWLKYPLNGKTFNPDKPDISKEFGKEIFAKHVVKPNADDINFSGFDPFLDRIISVFNHFY